MLHGLISCSIELCFRPAKCFEGLCRIHHHCNMRDDVAYALRVQQETEKDRQAREASLQSLYRIRGDSKRSYQSRRTAVCLIDAPLKVGRIVYHMLKERPTPGYIQHAIQDLGSAIAALGDSVDAVQEEEEEEVEDLLFESIAESDAYFTFKLDNYIPLVEFSVSPTVLKQIGRRIQQAAIYVRVLKPELRWHSYVLARAAYQLIQAARRLEGRSIPGLLELEAIAAQTQTAIIHQNGIHVGAFAADPQNVHTPPAVSSTEKGIAYLLSKPAPLNPDTVASITAAIPTLTPVLKEEIVKDCEYTVAFNVTYKEILGRVWDFIDYKRLRVNAIATMLVQCSLKHHLGGVPLIASPLFGLVMEEGSEEGGKESMSDEEREAWAAYAVFMCPHPDLTPSAGMVKMIVQACDTLLSPFQLIRDTLALHDELLTRFEEEIEDGVGMCHQGKMTRLVNVLRGFDRELDKIENGVTREEFQNKIALLRDLPIEERRARSEALFVEFALVVPADEHDSWREALMDDTM